MIQGTARAGAIVLALALSLGVAFSASPSRAVAQDTSFVAGDAVVVFDGRLNLREAAGLAAEIVEVLEDGAALTVLAGPQTVDSIPWYQVSTENETEGWVSGEFIRAAAGEGEFAAGDAVVVADGPLNLRDAAGTDATILDTLADGTAGTILDGPTAANNFDWYQIELADESSGWVAGDFLDLASDGGGDFAAGDLVVATARLNLRDGASLDGAVLETLDEGTTGTVLDGPSVGGDFTWYQIEVTDGETGWVAGEFLALADDGVPPSTGDFPIDSFIFVNAPVVNLRENADIDSEILDTLDEGTLATVLDGPTTAGDYIWYQVTVGDGEDAQEGWVSGALMSGGLVLNEEAVVLEGPLNLREEASTSADAIAALEAGDIVTVVAGPASGSGFSWFEVESGDDTGFVAGRYLGLVEAETEATEAPQSTEATET